MNARLAALFVHPIKSAAGIACESAVLGPYGLQHDREWMIVDPAGRFVTQREESRLALLRVSISNGALHLVNPEGKGPSIALDHQGDSVQVMVWRSNCVAFDAGAEVAQFLSGWLGRPLRLVRFDTRKPRHSNPDWTDGRSVPNRFADGYPLLVLSEGSIADLSARVGSTLGVERFRPNVLLGDVPPYAEDAHDALIAGAAQFRLTKACTRCVITTIDPQRGERDGDEPLRTLKSYRHDKALRGVIFGRNAYAIAGEGTVLTRGMPLALNSH